MKIPAILEIFFFTCGLGQLELDWHEIVASYGSEMASKLRTIYEEGYNAQAT